MKMCGLICIKTSVTQLHFGLSNIRMHRFTKRVLAIAFLMSWLTGCDDGGIGAIPIRGKVLYNGKPLAQGEVLYNPLESTGRRAKGKIQSDGTFQLTTLEQNDGALPGDYQISILAYAPHPGEPTRTVESEQRDQIRERIKRGFIIPEKYVDPTTSGLTDQVSKEHSGYKEIVLED